MGYLDKLRQICADYTERAQSKEEIEKATELAQAITQAEKDEAETLETIKELKASYKDAILHGSYGENKTNDIDGTKPVSFEDYIKNKFKD